MVSGLFSFSLWMSRLTFLVFALVILVVQLVPLDLRPATWAPPDLLLPFTLAWMARRPDYLPVWMVGGLFLVADMLLMRPPGLYAAMVVVLAENVRSKALERRFTTFGGEWGTVAVGIVIIALALLYKFGENEVSIHFYIAAALGIGFPMLLTSALMGLVFLSSGTGHDESIDDPLRDD